MFDFTTWFLATFFVFVPMVILVLAAIVGFVLFIKGIIHIVMPTNTSQHKLRHS